MLRTHLITFQIIHNFAYTIARYMPGEAILSSADLAMSPLSLTFFNYATKNALLCAIGFDIVLASKIQ